MAWLISSSTTAGVSTTIRSTSARIDANCRVKSFAPEVSAKFGPGPLRPLRTWLAERWASVSATSTLRPRRWAASARCTATVLLPEPPLRAMTAIVRMKVGGKVPGDGEWPSLTEACDISATCRAGAAKSAAPFWFSLIRRPRRPCGGGRCAT